MKQKLDKVLLIDDSDADNFIHERVIKKAGVANNIIIQKSGPDALEYLATMAKDGSYPVPELVFLDINMPGMNGWEFLEQYEKLPQSQKAQIIVCMLTTSISEVDKKKAEKVPQIKSYQHKPLSHEMLMEILQVFFPERF
jgi:CheY-like chemotaxis protein